MTLYRVRVGLVLEYEVDAESSAQVRAHVAATRRAVGALVDVPDRVWAGPDVISCEEVPA